MKKGKKILALVLAAVMLVCTTVAATVAYLTSTTEVVKNTFTVGNVAITLDEAKVTVYGEQDGDTRVKENEYKLIPGHNYKKDPTIHVDSLSEDCLLFVKVVDGLAKIEAPKTIETQMLEKGWEKLTDVANVWYWTGDEDKDTVTDNPVSVAAGADVVVFDDFTLTGNAAVEDYEKASITIVAYAVQADGFEGKTATEVWTTAPTSWEA